MEINQIARVLMGLGILLFGIGLLFFVGQRLGLGRLPGDLLLKRPGVTFYVPLATSLLVSLLLTLLFNLWARRR